MKSHFYVLVLFLVLLMGCKSESSDNEFHSVEEVKSEQTSDSELSSIYSYYKSEPSSLAEKQENKIIDYATDHNWAVTRTPEGVYYMLIKSGIGKPIKWADKLKVHYKGYLLNGKIFDSSYRRGKPISFKVGNMIDGWNRTLTKLKRGDHATLIIPSRLAYGEEGLGKLIKPNEILIFEIEILDEQ